MAGALARGSGVRTLLAGSPLRVWPGVRATFGLARSTSTPVLGDIHPFFDVMGSRVTAASIDSLFVTVTKVEVLPDSIVAACRPPVGDPLTGFHPGEPGEMRGLEMGRSRTGFRCGRGLGLGRIGGMVVLIFDAGQMLSGKVVVHDGKVVLAPMLRPRW